MKKMFDYNCSFCHHDFEMLTETDEVITCPNCKTAPADKRATGGHIFNTIKATTNTSGRYKAGYVHKYQKRPAEKIYVQVPASPEKL